MLVFVMYYIYVTSGSSLLMESTDSMMMICNHTKITQTSIKIVNKVDVGMSTCKLSTLLFLFVCFFVLPFLLYSLNFFILVYRSAELANK